LPFDGVAADAHKDHFGLRSKPPAVPMEAAHPRPGHDSGNPCAMGLFRIVRALSQYGCLPPELMPISITRRRSPLGTQFPNRLDPILLHAGIKKTAMGIVKNKINYPGYDSGTEHGPDQSLPLMRRIHTGGGPGLLEIRPKRHVQLNIIHTGKGHKFPDPVYG